MAATEAGSGLDDRLRHGVRRHRDQGRTIPVPVDEETLAELADTTGGQAYTAASGDELTAVYEDIGSSIGWRTEPRELTPYLAAFALLLMTVGGAMSLRWFARLP